MSMLTLNGTVQNVFSKAASTDPKTGEIRPASTHAQILAENILESGEKRLEMVTLKVHAPDAFRKLVGQVVRVPVGAFVSGSNIQYYALKNEAMPA
jgi:hypothetical protein